METSASKIARSVDSIKDAARVSAEGKSLQNNNLLWALCINILIFIIYILVRYHFP